VHVRQAPRQLERQLVRQERLAMAEPAEHQDEPGLVCGQPRDDLVEGMGGDRGGRAVDAPDPLRHIQLRRVIRVGAQPLRLPSDIAA
jgi:hypothetical protein